VAGYTKEFLVDAFVSRYAVLGPKVAASQRALATAHYDKVGRDAFRVSASLDAAAIRVFKAKPQMTWSEAIKKLT
jgi:hypothetical protein